MASETLAKLVVKMEADSARLQKDLDKANGRINKFKNDTTSHFRFIEGSINSMVGALAAIVSVRALVQLTREVSDAALAVKVLSERTGASTQFIDKMTYAAETSGATFENVRMAMEKLEQATVKGRDGSKEMADAFNALSISVKEFAKYSPEQRFRILAEAVKQSGQSADTTRATFAILGDSAGKLDRLLRNGAQGMQQLGDEAERVGVVMSEKTVKAMADLDAQLDKTDQNWKSLKITIAEAIGLPTVTWINKLTDAYVIAWKASMQLPKEMFLTNKTIKQLADDYDRSHSGILDPKSLFRISEKNDKEGLIPAGVIKSAAQKDAENYSSEFANSLNELNRKESEFQDVLRKGADERLRVNTETLSNINRAEDEYQNNLREQAEERLRINSDTLSALNRHETEYQENLSRMWKAEADARRSSILSSTSSTLGSLAILADGHNKKAFKMSQRLARAQALVDAVAAATAAAKSAASLGPFAAFAAYTSVAVGLAARIKQINSMSYESGGGSISAGGGGATATTPNSTQSGVPISNDSNQRNPVVVQITVNGSVYPADLNQLIVGEVQRFVDNDGVLVQRNSATAREIMRA